MLLWPFKLIITSYIKWNYDWHLVLCFQGGIRTNTTVCLGKIACYISPQVRHMHLELLSSMKAWHSFYTKALSHIWFYISNLDTGALFEHLLLLHRREYFRDFCFIIVVCSSRDENRSVLEGGKPTIGEKFSSLYIAGMRIWQTERKILYLAGLKTGQT